MKFRVVAGMLALACLLSACGESDNLDAPRKFFGEHMIGSSADFGVMKFGDDHVITVHGFTDDAEACEEVVTAMNINACKETRGRNCLNPYSCAPLNH